MEDNSSESQFKIFLSHSSLNNDLASIFYSYLIDGLGFEKKDIFCTLENNNQITMSDNFNNTILEALKRTEGIILFLITPEFLESQYCFYEMGAAWALGIRPCIIYISPFTISNNVLHNLPFKQVHAKNLICDNKQELISTIISITSDIQTIIKKNYNNLEIINARTFFVENVYNLGFKKVIPIDLLNSGEFGHPQNKRNIVSYNKANSCTKIKLDFTDNIPEYVMFAIFVNSDWSSYVSNNYYLKFQTKCSATIRSADLEFKDDYKEVINRIKLNFNNTNEFQIDLKHYLSKEIERTKNISELVFVFHEYDLDEVGVFEIGNLEITNF